MVWQFSILQIPPLIAALLSLGLFYTVWKHREDTLSQAFLVFIAGVFVWSALYTAQLGFTDLETKLVIDKLLYVGAVTVPTAWLVLTARYAGRDEWLTRRTMALLAIEPVLTLLVVATSPLHELLYQEVTLLTTTWGPILSMTYGPAYWLNLGYSYLIVLYGIALLVDVLIRGLPLYRRQAGLLLVGAVIPLGANVLFATGQSPLAQVDLTTFTFAITGTVIAVALFKFDFLSRTPVARRRMSEVLGHGFIILDEHDTIVNYNDVADQVFGGIETDSTLGDVFTADDVDGLDGTEFEAEVDGHTRHYIVRCLDLDGRRDTSVGHLLTFREITHRKAYEQRLEVTNRLLRHNLRNDTNIILGHAANLERSVSEEALDDVHAIQTTATRLADLSQKATQLEATLDHDGTDPVTVDTVPLVADLIDRIRTSHPDISITTDLPATATARTISSDLLETAVANLLENAVEHTDREPELRVTITTGDVVRIRVADNGPGIPEMERTVLEEGQETPLEHGSGLGLWLVHWIATESGGQVTFTENDPRGSIVSLELPPGTDQPG